MSTRKRVRCKAELLALCDVGDRGEMSGIWKSRAELKLDVADIQKQLATKEKTFYLGCMEVENEAG